MKKTHQQKQNTTQIKQDCSTTGGMEINIPTQKPLLKQG